ncbi:hypothetical protein ACFVUB_11090 [Streptomyces niveus]|uniref:hypothetical protein n=1 Tax=Streptomyces niveus TaxID=193462 RepID=UPI0036DC8E6A
MATTAQFLIDYHRELTEGGLPPSLVEDIVKDAAQTIVLNEGLRVRPHPRGDNSPAQDTPST